MIADASSDLREAGEGLAFRTWSDNMRQNHGMQKSGACVQRRGGVFTSPPSDPYRYASQAMTHETSFSKPWLGIFEVGVMALCVLIVCDILTSSLSLAFSAFWTVVPLGVLAGFLGVIAAIRSSVAHAVPFLLVAIVIGVLNLPTVPRMFPLRHRVEPAFFTDAKVADVLHHIARSKPDAPYWRFHVSNQQLAYTRVTMTIPDNASLGETLDLVVAQTGASYTWNWHKACGNEPSPLCASFYFTNDVTRDRYDNELLIDRYAIMDSAATKGTRGITKE